MKYEWNPKWTKDKNYNCTTCKWLRQGGQHWGCYFNDSYQRWLPQKLANRKAVCTLPDQRGKFRDSKNVHWDPMEGFQLRPVKPAIGRENTNVPPLTPP